jgi:hypothetical protein
MARERPMESGNIDAEMCAIEEKTPIPLSIVYRVRPGTARELIGTAGQYRHVGRFENG